MISCDQHDYVEIACLYRYRVKLTLECGEAVEGIALDVLYNNSREECIKIRRSNTDNLVILDSIIKMDALVENPHFKTVHFKSP